MKFVLHLSVLFSLLFQNIAFLQDLRAQQVPHIDNVRAMQSLTVAPIHTKTPGRGSTVQNSDMPVAASSQLTTTIAIKGELTTTNAIAVSVGSNTGLTTTKTMPAPHLAGDLAIEGGKLYATWKIMDENMAAAPERLRDLSVEVELPPGLSSGRMDTLPAEGREIFRVTPESFQGRVSIQPQGILLGDFHVTIRLYQGDTLLDVDTVTIPDTGKHDIGIQGGDAFALDGRVHIVFSVGAVKSAISLDARKIAQETGSPDGLSGHSFELTASTAGRAVHSFGQPLLIEYFYTGEFIPGNERGMQLYYFDEKERDWMALPSEVDTENNVLRAWTTHFTVFDWNIDDWQAARLPTVDMAQVSQFTGAATYAFPLWVPNGPGGLQPSLSLQYSSQTIDGANVQVQPSWVGMGWSLDVGSIERDMHGTMEATNDDTFNISFDGVSGRLIKNPNDGYYYTDLESFWRFKYYSFGNDSAEDNGQGYWVAWDGKGNKYIFGATDPGASDPGRAAYPRFKNCTHTDPFPHRCKDY